METRCRGTCLTAPHHNLNPMTTDDTANCKSCHTEVRRPDTSAVRCGAAHSGAGARGLFVAVAGNIGAGKTTLTRMLADKYGWEPRFEAVAQNPYLDDYYKNIHRWSFCLETFFLKERFRDLLDISQSSNDIIQDRSIFEGVHVFAANNKAMGNMDDRDYETFMELFEQMTSVARMPDLMIYLRASVPHLVANIQKRGRDYEQTIPIDYLKGLNERYEDFILNRYPGRVLTIEVDDLDFVQRRDDFKFITEKIDRIFYGLF